MIKFIGLRCVLHRRGYGHSTPIRRRRL